jgi:hypothetical protein
MGILAGSRQQILSRFTSELLQTLIGSGYSQFINSIGKINSEENFDGATILKCSGNYLPYSRQRGIGLALGHYIIGNNAISAHPDNAIFQHEYGHYLQSQSAGLAYIPGYALPSLWGDNKKYGHDYNPVEQDANARAIQYFYNKTGGKFTWDFKANPIGYPGTKWKMSDYFSPEFQALLKNLRISPSWHDYAGWVTGPIGPVCSAFYHSIFYKNNPIDGEHQHKLSQSF